MENSPTWETAIALTDATRRRTCAAENNLVNFPSAVTVDIGLHEIVQDRNNKLSIN